MTLIPRLVAFRRLTVRVSLGILACGILDTALVRANQDVLMGPNHEPTLALFLHFATALFMSVSGFLFLVRDWVSRHHPRGGQSSPFSPAPAQESNPGRLEQLVTDLAVNQTVQQRDISELRSDLDNMKGDIGKVIHEEFGKVNKTMETSVAQVTSIVAIARELLGKLDGKGGKKS